MKLFSFLKMGKEKKYGFNGFKASEIDGTEHVFGTSAEMTLPIEYSYRKFMPKVLNQGSDPICVPCSVSAFLNWRENLKDGKPNDNKIDYFEIYDCKTTDGEGMTFKEAFKFLRHHGVKSNLGKLQIGEYALITSFILLKYALLMNGPCVGALPVYNYSNEFWKQNRGDYILGYHAVSIVGYDKEGFIIRNSWGTSFGNGGYTKLKYEDFGNFIEIWTIVS